MATAIRTEIDLRKHEVTEAVETIYFGGGTPSLLPHTELQLILSDIKSKFTVLPDAEITLEANPDDISINTLESWKAGGINRLSIGVQSFDEEELQWMNRAHTAQQSFKSLKSAADYFNNISIDLIYGTPLLSNGQWLNTLTKTSLLNITHLSCYALTVEDGTALSKMIEQGKKENTSADKQAEHFEILMQWAVDNGYEHYEISNFAKPNHRSKHNSSYWLGRPYLGIGPSAHSFTGSTRQWNVANNALYIKSIEQGIVPFEKEILTPTQQMNEYIMTALRRIEGINLNNTKWQVWGNEARQKVVKAAKKWEANNNIIITEDAVKLTNRGKFLADGIAADLFQ